MLKRYIGDLGFYRRVLGIAIPIIIQNGITQFVSLLDNLMVGQVGTLEMSGVSIVNQLILVFNLCIFGANSGAGIFTAQFHGSGDYPGVRYTLRFKVLICTAISTLGISIFLLFGQPLALLYLQGDGDPAAAAATLDFALKYLRVMLFGLLPFGISTAYATTLRETGRATVPMLAGVAAVLVNLVLNYILIFGHFGFKAMGVEGAAIATVISRYVEMGIIVIWTHCNGQALPFIKGLYSSLYIPGSLLKKIAKKGLPLLANEFLWSSGVAVMTQSYSTCGLNVVPALNITTTVSNLASVVSMALGNSVGIVMGQMLGGGKEEREVRDANRKLIALAVACATVFGCLLVSISGLFPMLYKTEPEVQALAATLIRIVGVMMPISAFTLATYFTLRSGGQAFITFLFDSCFMWVCPVPLSILLCRFTGIDIIPLYTLCQGVDILRAILGAFMIKHGKWIRNLTV